MYKGSVASSLHGRMLLYQLALPYILQKLDNPGLEIVHDLNVGYSKGTVRSRSLLRLLQLGSCNTWRHGALIETAWYQFQLSPANSIAVVVFVLTFEMLAGCFRPCLSAPMGHIEISYVVPRCQVWDSGRSHLPSLWCFCASISWTLAELFSGIYWNWVSLEGTDISGLYLDV